MYRVSCVVLPGTGPLPGCGSSPNARWGPSQARPVRPACTGAESACQGTQLSYGAGQASAKG